MSWRSVITSWRTTFLLHWKIRESSAAIRHVYTEVINVARKIYHLMRQINLAMSFRHSLAALTQRI